MTSSPTAPAPEPDGLWLFDGVCNLCSGSVLTILRLDPAGAIRFTPIQSPYGRMLAAAAGLDPDTPQTFLFFDQGRALGRSDAIVALLARLSAPWRWLGAVRFVPRSWRDRAYDWVATNRYRIWGRKDACMVPSPEVRARFLIEPPA